MSYLTGSEKTQQTTAEKKTQTKRKKVRVHDILAAKGQRKLTALTCYDATMARLLEQTPIDIVLVGDSLGHVVQGKNSTIPVTLRDMLYHTRCVAELLKTPFLVADMPFGYAGFSHKRCIQAAIKLIKAGAEAVKIEGATPEICATIQTLVQHGIPVMGHIGLTPQSIHSLGGYRIQGRSQNEEQALVESAMRLEQAGCFALVLELIEAQTAQHVTESIKIPTIGIGAGVRCDGQILVSHDMLGMNLSFAPSFLKRYAELEPLIIDAVNKYCCEVQEEKFPST